MKEEKIDFDDRLCNKLMLLANNTLNLDIGIELIEDFERYEIDLSISTLNFFFHVMIEKSSLDNAIDVYQNMLEQKKVDVNTETLLTLLHGKHGNLSKVSQNKKRFFFFLVACPKITEIRFSCPKNIFLPCVQN